MTSLSPGEVADRAGVPPEYVDQLVGLGILEPDETGNLSSTDVQKERALKQSNLPTIVALYDDADIAEEQPIIPNWKEVFQNAVPRPSAATKVKYNEVSSKFWTAVHKTLSGNGTAAENLEMLEVELTELEGSGW